MGSSETPLLEFLSTESSETPVVEFLRTRCAKDLIPNKGRRRIVAHGDPQKLEFLSTGPLRLSSGISEDPCVLKTLFPKLWRIDAQRDSQKLTTRVSHTESSKLSKGLVMK